MADNLIIETRGLTKEFNGFLAVQDVDPEVRRPQLIPSFPGCSQWPIRGRRRWSGHFRESRAAARVFKTLD